MKKITRGFTLIELLIVIALLGALAVALLAALDPLEQIKKGT
ncbi:MAG: prepilin-type N-terminal cleavage/methylation domain-containing protein, partial [bacterium]